MSRFSEEVKSKKTDAILSIIARLYREQIKDALVVGCGSGREAGMLARAFSANVIGIDVGHDFSFDHEGSAPAKLLFMDARNLDFPANSFDLVFSFHALEHIPNPQLALHEMARVLRPGGMYLIGTPNKSRLAGGYSSALPLGETLMGNVEALWMRMTGRWSNEAGAHAGFTAKELTDYCSTAFGEVQDISEFYYRNLHSRHATTIAAIAKSGVRQFIFPALYVSGVKRPNH